MTIRTPYHRLSLLLILLTLISVETVAQPYSVVEKHPLNGATSVWGCGPIGVKLDRTIAFGEDLAQQAFRVRGSRSGTHIKGQVSVENDELTFIPLIPFLAGETVEATLRNLPALDILDAPLTWTFTVRPGLNPENADYLLEAQQGYLSDWMEMSQISLVGAFDAEADGLESLEWDWGDMDADGDLDGVILGKYEGHSPEIVLLEQESTLLGVVWNPLDGDTSAISLSHPISLKLGDLNNNRKMDLILFGVAEALIWLDPKPDEALPNSADYTINLSTFFYPSSISVGDVNSDGHADLVFANYNGSQLRAYLNYLHEDTPYMTAVNSTAGPLGFGADEPRTTTIKSLGLLCDMNEDGTLDMGLSAYDNLGSASVYMIGDESGGGEFSAGAQFNSYSEFVCALFFGRQTGMSVPFADLNLAVPRTSNPGIYRYRPNVQGGTHMNPQPFTLPVDNLRVEIVHAQFSSVFSDTDPFINDYPEFLFCDHDTESGFLRMRQLNTGGDGEGERFDDYLGNLGSGIDRLIVADFDFDLDADIMICDPDLRMLTIYSSLGGMPQHAQEPGPSSHACGVEIEFPTVEVDCSTYTMAIPFQNVGVFPAEIDSVEIVDGNAYSVTTSVGEVFSGGCGVSESSIMVEVTFDPPTTGTFTDTLVVHITWIGAGEGGADELLICEFPLRGKGGIYAGEAVDPAKLFDLSGSANNYTLTFVNQGDTIDFGRQPRHNGANRSETVTLLNTGDFNFGIENDATLPAGTPFSIFANQDSEIEVGSNAAFDVEFVATQGALGLNERTVNWSVTSLNPTEHCLGGQSLDQVLRVILIDPQVCLVPNEDCDPAFEPVLPDDCEEVIPLGLCEGLNFSYCLSLMGFDWDDSQPVMSITGNKPSWLNITQTDWDTPDRYLHLWGIVGESDGDFRLTVAETRTNLESISCFRDLEISVNPTPEIGAATQESGWLGQENPAYDCDQLDATGSYDNAWCLEETGIGIAKFPLGVMGGGDNAELDIVASCTAGEFDPNWVEWVVDPADQNLGLLRVTPQSGICSDACECVITLIVRDLFCAGQEGVQPEDSIQVLVRIVPALPDLEVLEWNCPQGPLLQNHPFEFPVRVRLNRIVSQTATVSLTSPLCTISAGEEVALTQGVISTVTFTVESCSQGGDLPFTATIESSVDPELDYDFTNNTYTDNCYIEPDRSPEIHFEILEYPEDGDLVECAAASDPCNEVDSDPATSDRLCLKETNSLRFRVWATDPDGDTIDEFSIEEGSLDISSGGWVAIVDGDDTWEKVITLTPPEGVTTEGLCQHMGNFLIKARALNRVTVDQSLAVWVKCDCPDLSAHAVAPGQGVIGDELSFAGTIHCEGNDAEDLVVTLSMLNPAGSTVISDTYEIDLLAAGADWETPELNHIPEMEGRYCIQLIVAIEGGRDADPANNNDLECFQVDPGPFIVLPNTVTPNGDGFNDQAYFHFSNQALSAPILRVFNLAGKQIYEDSSPDTSRRLSWSGRDDSGSKVPPGSYLYVIYDGGSKFSSGVLGVVR